MPKKYNVTSVLMAAIAAIIIFFVIEGGEVITGYVGFSSYNSTPSTVNTTNPGPTVDNCTAIDEPNDASNVNQVTLYAGGVKNVRCLCTVNDNSGGADFNTTGANINGTLYYTTASSSWTADNYQHYVNTSCEIGSIINMTSNQAKCRFNVWFNAHNSTDAAGTTGWTCNIWAKDNGDNSSATAGADTFAILPLTALSICSQINFGTLSPGDVSAETNCTVNNWGNIKLNLQLNGTNMTGQGLGTYTGQILAGSIKYNCTNTTAGWTSDFAWNSRTANLSGLLSDSTANCNLFWLSPNMTASAGTSTPTSNNTMWRLRVPNNARGNFGGTVWFVGLPG